MIVKCKACKNSYNLDDNKSCPFCGSTSYLTPEKISELEQRRQDDLYERSYAKKKIEEQRDSFKKLIIGGCVGVILLIVLLISLSVMGVNKAKLTKYNNAITLMEQGDYENALNIFKGLGGYSDSSEYVKTVESLITERNAAYENGKTYFQAEQYDKAIVEFSNCKGYEDSDEYINKASAFLYEQAENEYNLNHLEKAKELLLMIPQSADEYNKALVLSSNIDDELIEIANAEMYSRAIDAYNEADYETAQKLFIQLAGYNDSASYLEKIGEQFYGLAETASNNKQYDEFVRLIALIDTSEEWKRYSEAVNLRDSVKNAYCEEIMSEGKSICRKEGVDAMKSYIDGLKCNLFSDADIQELKEACTIEIVSLGDMEPYYKASDEHISEERGFVDLTGNTYDYALVSKLDDYGYDYEWVYQLSGKYTIFAADIVVEKDPGGRADGSVRIYGDGVLLFSQENIGPTTKSYPIEIDITGVSDLAIVVNGDHSSWTAFGLGNPRVIE